jgi:hypothetical protein
MPLTEQKRVEKTEPEFTHAVRGAIRSSADPVTVQVSLDAFYDNAVLLYLCLWYADSFGVRVTFEPTSDGKGSDISAGSSGNMKRG